MTTATAPVRPTERRRVRRTSRWWVWLAGAALIPSLLPMATLVWGLAVDGTVAAVPLPRLFQLLVNTLALAGAVTAMATAIGVGTAWATTKTGLAGRRTWSVLVVLPLVMPSYVVALTLLGATGPEGVLTRLLGLSDLPTPTGFIGSWIALTVFAVPYVHLAVVPAIRSIDPSLEEASRNLGKGRTTTFRRVTLPMLRPALAASALLVSLYTISDFGVVSLLRYDTFTRAIYAQYAGRLDRRPALTLAAVLAIVALLVVWIERRSRRHAAYHADTPRRHRPIRLGRLGTLTTHGLLGSLVVVSLGLPGLVLVTWLVRGLTGGVEVAGVVAEATRSLGVALAAAGLAAVLAIPLAMVIVRGSRRLGAFAETTSWATYALPHIAVGLAMVTFALRAAPILYQTIALVVVAHIAMFLPQSMGTAVDALRRIPPDLDDASRSLGKSAAATTFRITIPLMTRGLLAGSALVFLTSMKELPATLLLRPNGFETLAIRIWAATGEGFYTRASAAALVLIAVSFVPLFLVTLRDLDR